MEELPLQEALQLVLPLSEEWTVQPRLPRLPPVRGLVEASREPVQRGVSDLATIMLRIARTLPETSGGCSRSGAIGAGADGAAAEEGPLDRMISIT